MASLTLRGARVGDRLPRRLLDHASARRIDATALLVPGADAPTGRIDAWRATEAEFSAWDGRVVVAESDGESEHRLLVVDRYGQVYAVHDTADADQLPDAGALSEWFRFLATACPECGVIDDPLLAGPTP
jgi:hypothetical protein